MRILALLCIVSSAQAADVTARLSPQQAADYRASGLSIEASEVASERLLVSLLDERDALRRELDALKGGVLQLTYEAEDAQLTGNWRVAQDTKAVGGRYAECLAAKTGPNTLTFRVTTIKDTELDLWVRVKAEAATSDSYIVQVDAFPSYVWQVPRATGWTDRKVTDAHPIIMRAGQHTVSFTYREAARIDQLRIVLTTP